MKYYAHSPKDNSPGQSYADHVKYVRQAASVYASEVAMYAKCGMAARLKRIAELAATYHDLGKLSPQNQEVLSGRKRARSLPHHHADAGAAHLLSGNDADSIIAGILVGSHHRGLPSFAEEQNYGNMGFRDAEMYEITNAMLADLEKVHDTLVPAFPITPPGSSDAIAQNAWRILLSCLVDADHSDTAAHYKREQTKESHVQLRPLERLSALDAYISTIPSGTDRDILRSKMYQACRNSVKTSNAIVCCDSPVGSGKTTAIMAFLLSQAHVLGLRRIFVVLPFTNIITQSADVYRKALTLPDEDPREVVSEVHHNADFEDLASRQYSVLWRAPIIVTTAVAFFETLASSSTATLRRLHELPGSSIFVDEAHAALPAHLLPIAWRWMNEYASEWKCRWTLASGSLNKFWEIEEIKGNEISQTVDNIVSSDLREALSKYEQRRVSFKADISKPKSADELISWSGAFQGPRLLIVNTVQSAAVIADLIRKTKGRDSVEHLSTALTPNDRSKTLHKVRQRLLNKNDQDWTLVATSCVEAGVDISFRTGFRELASLSSLIQSSGRVNRSGEYPDAEMWTFLLRFDEMLLDNPSFHYSSEVLRNLINNGIDITPELTTTAIKQELRIAGKGADSFQKIIKNENTYDFPSVEELFKVIDSDTVIAVIDRDLANRIRSGHADYRDLLDASIRLQKYKLKDSDAIAPGIYHWNLGYNDFLGYMAGVLGTAPVEEINFIW